MFTPQPDQMPPSPFHLLPSLTSDEVARLFNALEDRARRFDYVRADDLLVEAAAFVGDHLTALASRHGARHHLTIDRAIYLARRVRRLEAAVAASSTF